MSMPDDPALPPLNPKDTTNFLLGGIVKQLDTISVEQRDQRVSGEAFRDEVRQSVAELRSDVDTLKAKQTPKAPWYATVGGYVGIIGGASGAVALLRNLNP